MKKLLENQFKDFLFIIQARLNSSRLPNKVLLSLKGKSILEFLYLQIKKEFTRSKIIVAIPDSEKNLLLRKYLKKIKIKYDTGPEYDLVSRYQKVCKNINSKYIVRLTCDNPLINFKLIKYCLKSHLLSKKNFSSTRNIVKKKIFRFFPKGHSVDIINKYELMKIDSKKLSSYEKEHLVPYLYKNLNCNFIKNKKLREKLKLKSQSVDTLKDYFKII